MLLKTHQIFHIVTCTFAKLEKGQHTCKAFHRIGPLAQFGQFGVLPGFSLSFPGVFQGFSRGFPGVFPRFSRDFPRIFPGFSKDFFSSSFVLNHATSPKLYRSYCPHRSRDSVSPVCRILRVVFNSGYKQLDRVIRVVFCSG